MTPESLDREAVGRSFAVQCASPASRYLAGPTTSEDAAMSDIDRERLLARFWAKVNKTDTCWLWTACTFTHPSRHYGCFSVNGRSRGAHRVAYEALVGPIPDGLTIDHLCRVTLCVNPDHLEAVPMRVNTLRGFGPTAENKRKVVCCAGHDLTPENTLVRVNGQRECRSCRRVRRRAYKARRRALARKEA